MNRAVQTILDDEQGYRSWLRQHPTGLVVNADREPRPAYLVLHRATCTTISQLTGKGTNFTTAYSKTCSEDPERLRLWAHGTGGTVDCASHDVFLSPALAAGGVLAVTSVDVSSAWTVDAWIWPAMLMAQLRGKLPSESWLTSEDLLTSAVFGTLKNLSPEIVCSLFASARAFDGSSGPCLRGPLTWTFWPWWDTCEPDVVVEDAHTLVVIEVKLLAEFGEDTGGGLQLLREWRAGERRARAAGKDCFLLTVTNHVTPPVAAVRRQLATANAPAGRVCWLGWDGIARFVAALRASPDVKGWADDLVGVLDRMDLRPFQGFGSALAQARTVPSADVPWLGSVLVPPDRQRVAGFGAAVALSRGASATWRFEKGTAATS